MILGRRRTAKNFADVLDDGIASDNQFTNDFEFGPWFVMVCGRSVLGKAVTDETKRGGFPCRGGKIHPPPRRGSSGPWRRKEARGSR